MNDPEPLSAKQEDHLFRVLELTHNLQTQLTRNISRKILTKNGIDMMKRHADAIIDSIESL